MPKLPKQLAKELDLIHKLESQAAGRAIRIGAWLWQAKAQLRHGEFKGWIDQHVEGRGYRACAFYMKLALAFVEKSKISEPQLAALCAHNFKGTPKSSAGKEAAERLATFIGDHSLNELLIKHGIKSVGLKGELTAGDEAPPAATEGEQMDLVWSQAYEPAKSLADLLTERAATLAPDRRDAIAAELQRALQALRSV